MCLFDTRVPLRVARPARTHPPPAPLRPPPWTLFLPSLPFLSLASSQAHAVNFDTCTQDFFYPVSGTSAASPTVAGIFGLLNEVRAEAGKSPLGFLNPMLYSSGFAANFNDCSSGKNDYCNSPEAFPATAGWDAATGCGSPNYVKLKAAVLALP